MSAPIIQTVLADGRISLCGGTYPLRETIRVRGGKWDPAAKTWTLPAGTDLSFLPAAPAPPAPKPVPRAAPKTREEWTAAEWQSHVAAQYRRRRFIVGACCSHAVSYYDYPQGPTNYRCERHGYTICNYTGD
jgi:hypothetical protein